MQPQLQIITVVTLCLKGHTHYACVPAFSCPPCLFSFDSNPLSTKLFNFKFKSLEVVSRYRDTQLQVTKNFM